MSKAVETLKRLTGNRISYRVLEEFADFPGVPEIGISAPDYKLALALFDERFPERANENKWTRLRQGFNLAFEEFHEELESKLDLLVADKESRLAYLKRLLQKLYTGQYSYQKLATFVEYFKSDSFEALKGKLDDDLWEELDTIGYAAWVSEGYTIGTDYTLEQELKLEGIPLEHGWLAEDKNATTKQNHSQFNSARTTISIVETLRGLINSNKSYGQLMQLAKLSGFEDVTPIAPDYSIAFKYFDETFPKVSVLDRSEIIGIVYRKVHEDFTNELETKLEVLLTDKENRVVYIKRIFDKLYTTPERNQQLMKIESAINSDKFDALRGEIDTNLWLDLKEIGVAILQSVTYALAVGKRLEEELQINGIVIEGGYLTKPKNNNDSNVNKNNNPTNKPKRVNTDAREKHAFVLVKYDRYIKDGYGHKGAIQKLMHDFRLEYAPKNSDSRKSQLLRIIRERNNKRQ